jgi:hypothetical protein
MRAGCISSASRRRGPPASLTLDVRKFGCMQIAGNKCRVCEHTIVLSSEGKYCGGCAAFVHVTCEPAGSCPVCGQAFQEYERPKPDPMREAVLPRALRPARSGGPLMVALLILFVVVVFLVIYYAIETALARGH